MKSGQIAIGVVLVSVAAALAAYVTDVFGSHVTAASGEREWAADHAAMVELADRVELPTGYTPVACRGDEESRCWHADRGGDAAAADVRAALEAAGLSGVSETCQEVLGVERGSCSLSAPFGHDRQVTVTVAIATASLGADQVDDPAAVAAAGVDVTFLVPALEDQ